MILLFKMEGLFGGLRILHRIGWIKKIYKSRPFCRFNEGSKLASHTLDIWLVKSATSYEIERIKEQSTNG
jgi:hypothetical protein